MVFFLESISIPLYINGYDYINEDFFFLKKNLKRLINPTQKNKFLSILSQLRILEYVTEEK